MIAEIVSQSTGRDDVSANGALDCRGLHLVLQWGVKFPVVLKHTLATHVGFYWDCFP